MRCPFAVAWLSDGARVPSARLLDRLLPLLALRLLAELEELPRLELEELELEELRFEDVRLVLRVEALRVLGFFVVVRLLVFRTGFATRPLSVRSILSRVGADPRGTI